jgi:transcriptional regulator with XRE-family HTH domain
MNAVGNHIRKLRKQHKLSQQALAEKLNVTQETVSQWEDSGIQPDIGTLERIAEALGADIHEVIYGEKQGETSCPAIPRKWYWIGLIVFGLLTLFAITGYLLLRPYFIEQQQQYNIWPSIMYTFFIRPLNYLFIPMAVLSGCSLLWDIRIRHRYIRISILIVVAVYVSLHYAASWFYFGEVGGIPRFMHDYLLYFPKNPAIFLLPGIGLFFGLNGRKPQKKPDDQTL